MPDRAKQPFPGDKSYLMTNPGRILVFRQFLFLAGHPFHDSRVEIVRASRRDTKISVLIQAFDRVLRGLAEISLVQQMKNSVGEEGANFLPRPAPEHGAHIAGVEAGASSQRNTIFLPLLVRSSREGNGLWRYVNSDDIKAQLNKIERIVRIRIPNRRSPRVPICGDDSSKVLQPMSWQSGSAKIPTTRSHDPRSTAAMFWRSSTCPMHAARSAAVRK